MPCVQYTVNVVVIVVASLFVLRLRNSAFRFVVFFFSPVHCYELCFIVFVPVWQEKSLARLKNFRPPLIQKAYRVLWSLRQVSPHQVTYAIVNHVL